MSRAVLARRLGTSQAYVTKVLRGNVNLTLATLVGLAQAVGREVRLDLAPVQSSQTGGRAGRRAGAPAKSRGSVGLAGLTTVGERAHGNDHP